MPKPICLENTNTINTNPLPLILAGPIVRRAEPKSIYVWVCTSKKLTLGIRFYKGRAETNEKEVIKGEPIGQGFGETVRVGENLYVTLLTASPTTKIIQFPQGEEISYEIFILASEKNFNSPILLLDKKERSLITIDSADNLSPSFCLQENNYDNLRAVFGSCRKFHGEGEDLTISLFQQAYKNQPASVRPNGLFLLGDQIYADDVSDTVLKNINSISRKIFGYTEFLHNPFYTFIDALPKNETLNSNTVARDNTAVIISNPNLIHHEKWINPYNIELGERQEAICNAAFFTSTDGANHLTTLAEFCTMYLFAFNGEFWNYVCALKKENTPVLSSEPLQAVTTYKVTVPSDPLGNAKMGSQAMRRILANTPSYMMCDDHEITDDWNITNEWKKSVLRNSLGKRIVTNGLCAFWMFQGWGNDPNPNDTRLVLFKEHAAKLLSKDFDSTTEETIINHCTKNLEWTFIAPTTPPTLFLDTRFNRENTPLNHFRFETRKYNYSSESPIISYNLADKTSQKLEDGDCIAPVLLNKKQIKHIKKILSKYEYANGFLIATPTPIFGLKSIESSVNMAYDIIKGIKYKDSHEAFDHCDTESWGCNPYSIDNFVGLMEEIYPKFAAGYAKDIHIKILSGDVHYSFNKEIEIYPKALFTPSPIRIQMITSSAIKNNPKKMQMDIGFNEGGEMEWIWGERRDLENPFNGENRKCLVFTLPHDDTSNCDYSYYTSIQPMYNYKTKAKDGVIGINGTFGYLMGLPKVYFIT